MEILPFHINGPHACSMIMYQDTLSRIRSALPLESLCSAATVPVLFYDTAPEDTGISVHTGRCPAFSVPLFRSCLHRQKDTRNARNILIHPCTSYDGHSARNICPIAAVIFPEIEAAYHDIAFYTFELCTYYSLKRYPSLVRHFNAFTSFSFFTRT